MIGRFIFIFRNKHSKYIRCFQPYNHISGNCIKSYRDTWYKCHIRKYVKVENIPYACCRQQIMCQPYSSFTDMKCLIYTILYGFVTVKHNIDLKFHQPLLYFPLNYFIRKMLLPLSAFALTPPHPTCQTKKNDCVPILFEGTCRNNVLSLCKLKNIVHLWNMNII